MTVTCNQGAGSAPRRNQMESAEIKAHPSFVSASDRPPRARRPAHAHALDSEPTTIPCLPPDSSRASPRGATDAPSHTARPKGGTSARAEGRSRNRSNRRPGYPPARQARGASSAARGEPQANQRPAPRRRDSISRRLLAAIRREVPSLPPNSRMRGRCPGIGSPPCGEHNNNTPER